MSSSVWARVARTCLIRPRVGSGPTLSRSYVLLAAKPPSSLLLRSIPLITRQQSSAAALLQKQPDNAAPSPSMDNSLEQVFPEFSSLKGVVHGDMLRALTRGPFSLTTMSPVQAAVLPLLPEIAQPYDSENPLASPRDLLVKARTGTGKTLAFLIPAVEARLKLLAQHAEKETKDAGLRTRTGLIESTQRKYARTHTGMVIISPTRELATQIANEARKLVSHLNLEVHLFVGGESKGAQLREFRRGAHDIIVVTPGRMNDILESVPEVAESVAHTQTLILDEADTLLDMGFQADILRIQKYMLPSPQRQTFLFSATISPQIRQIARQSLAKEHRFIDCVPDDAPPTHAHIPQYHTVLPSADHQIAHTLRIIAHDQLINPGKSKIIVFLPTTKMTEMYAELMAEVKKDSTPAGQNTLVYEIHSKKNMENRVRTSQRFREDTSGASVLITSDVSARGVDYPGVTRVVQVGIPASPEQYVHRVGRTGRAGTQGRGDLILLPWERKFVTAHMRDVPIKPLTVEELKEETLQLARNYDSDPKAFWGGDIPVVKSEKSYLKSRTLFRTTSLALMIEEIPKIVTEMMASANSEIVHDVFASLLGYYCSKGGELQISKADILEGCKKWSVDAGGLTTAPHVSEGRLRLLGFGSSETMDRVRRGGFREPRQNSWAGRGQQSLRPRDSSSDRGSRGFGRSEHWDRESGGGSSPRGFGGGSRDRGFGGGRDSGFGGGRDRGFQRNSDGPFGEKSFGERSPFGGKPRGERSFGEKSFGGRSQGERSFGRSQKREWID